MKKMTKDAQNGGKLYLGIFLGFIFAGCAGAAFPYKFYYLDLKTFDGTLIADKEEHDMPVTVCKLDPAGDHTCVVMMKADFQSLYLDYLDVKDKLVACEAKLP